MILLELYEYPWKRSNRLSNQVALVKEIKTTPNFHSIGLKFEKLYIPLSFFFLKLIRSKLTVGSSGSPHDVEI